MIIGIAFFIDIRPAADIVIITDVLVEDDCTSTVANMPTDKPAIGFLKRSLFLKVSPLVFPPRTLNALPIKPSDIMNMYNKSSTKTILEIVSNTVFTLSIEFFSDHVLPVAFNSFSAHMSTAAFASSGFFT
jgi:hypothetical protein